MFFRKTKKINNSSFGSFENKRAGIFVVVFVVIILLVSGLYLHFAWVRYREVAGSEVIILAQSIESLLHPEHITSLSVSDEDLENPKYLMIKRSLERLIESTDSIRFAYLLCERDGQIVFMVDSELAGHPDYSPPGQIYEEATDLDWEPFRIKKTVLTGLETDRWGTWISVLVPVIDPANDKIIAVLGLDFDGAEWYVHLWKHMIPDLTFALVFLLIFLGFLWFQKLRNTFAVGTAIYRSIFEQIPSGVAIIIDENILPPSKLMPITINPMFEHILGRTSTDIAHIKWSEITHPDDLQADLEKFEQFKNGEINGYSMEKRYIRPDGSSVWTNMKIAHLLESMDKHSMHLCLLEDITIRKEAEEALRGSERDKSILLSNLPGMAFRCNHDRKWTMLFVSDGSLALTGYAPESFTLNRDISYNDLILPEYRERIRKEWDRILIERLPFKHEYEIITHKGERKWVLEMGEGIYDNEGKVQALAGIILDISDRKIMEESLRYTYDHDVWTGLYNRQYFENLLNVDASLEATGQRALVGINLSAISSLSVTYGFEYSQQLIKNTVEILYSICTDKHQLFQTYVNRFVFYIKDYTDKRELSTFCQTIVSRLDVLFSIERTGYGIGIVEIEEDTQKDASQLLKDLLIASEIAIDTLETDTEICFFNRNMEARITRKETIKRELAEIAAEENPERLFLQFQPILDLASNRVCGFEALARVKSDYFGLVSPLEFMPLAEETKLIVPLGKKIIRQAFQLLNTLTQKGIDTIEVSINISAIQLLRKDFLESLFEIIHEMQVNPANICLEITESILAINYQEICRITEELRDRGLKISIDDFGTGYSSLARIRELDANYIKIDKFFIDKLLVIKPERAITDDIISMAHKLGSCVIAEGVEHEEQLQYLRQHGCDRIQGYLIARPLDIEVAIELLSDQGRANDVCNANGGQDKKGWW